MSFFEGWEEKQETPLGRHYRHAAMRAAARGFAESIIALHAKPVAGPEDIEPSLLLVIADQLWSEFPGIADVLRRQLNRE
jgi:hypothetical protein